MKTAMMMMMRLTLLVGDDDEVEWHRRGILRHRRRDVL